jgi:hypothetical protein
MGGTKVESPKDSMDLPRPGIGFGFNGCRLRQEETCAATATSGSAATGSHRDADRESQLHQRWPGIDFDMEHRFRH